MDSSDVPLSVKTGARKHCSELFPDASFIVREGCPQHFRSAAMALGFGSESRIRIENFQRQNDWRVGADRRVSSACECKFAYLHIVAGPLKPTAAGHAHFVQKPPVSDGHVGHHAGRPVKTARTLVGALLEDS